MEDLFYITYPEAFKIERKHRVSINRAASNVCERTGWDKMRRDNRGGGLIYFDPCDLISYASARLKCSDYGYQSQDNRLFMCPFFDQPDSRLKWWKL